MDGTCFKRARAALRLVALLAVAMLSLPPAAGAQTAPCSFILGFKTLHDLDAGDIGDCLDNQAFAGNGDAQQHTTKGLMAWRKADNWTAFTNGFTTWINGPSGLVSRLNTQRFSWEGDSGAPGTTRVGGALSITGFSVGPEQLPAYPSRVIDFPDEHTTFVPPGPGSNNWLVFAAGKVTATGGAVVLQTSDLKTFDFAPGYNSPVLHPAQPLEKCDPSLNAGFDANYAAPGSVLQDPTLPAGNLIAIYEAENHCPGGQFQHDYYATVGFARSSDEGKTWPPTQNSPTGGTDRYAALVSSSPEPPQPTGRAIGDAVPSAFIDQTPSGDAYLYVLYNVHVPSEPEDGLLRVARAKLGVAAPTFSKWNQGAFSQPGVGGADSGMLPSLGCASGRQLHADLTYNDDLGRYLLVYLCIPNQSGSGAWYYSNATSLDRQDWSAPRAIDGSSGPVSIPCIGTARGAGFQGFYPSVVSLGAQQGHSKLTGQIFYLSGCNDTGTRYFASKAFGIAAS